LTLSYVNLGIVVMTAWAAFEFEVDFGLVVMEVRTVDMRAVEMR
jgi:hypothetical protein